MFQTTIKGRIQHTEFYNGKHTTVIQTPAQDAYSHPQSFKIRSEAPFGNVGDEMTADVTIRGNCRQKPYRDKQTGEQKYFWDDNVYLDAYPVGTFKSQNKAT
jgi:hypothetical protein